MRRFALLGTCLLLSMPVSWANVVGTTDAALFPDTVDWCQLGCAGSALATPESWVSVDGDTGYVGLFSTGQNFYNLQAGSTWLGGFSNGMGLIYNGVGDGNSPDDIAMTFNQAEYGAGAYIDDTTGAFTATITLYDINYQPIGSYTTTGSGLFAAGTALFIGATSTTPVYAVQFDAIGSGAAAPDFAIGTAGLLPSAVPEPSFLLVIPALGLVGLVLRRRTIPKLYASLGALAAFCSMAQAQSATETRADFRTVFEAARRSGQPRPLVPASQVAPGDMRPHVWVTGYSVPAVRPATAAASSAPSFCNTSPAAGVIYFCWNGLQTVYGSNFPGSNGGAGITVGIVDAYHYANAASDLALYNSVMGLPACPVGTCFTQVNQVGGPPRAGAPVNNWDVETMLDIETVHSLAPNAKILLVEGDNATVGNLNTAVGTAITMADIVSNSYGTAELSEETSLDVAWTKPVLYSSGDTGAPGSWPCYSPYVTCVGGTTLTINSSLQRVSETGWADGGGGCSKYEAEPAYQTGFSPCAGTRAEPDVAADANPNTGILVYDSFANADDLILVGGTSLACPLTAALYADIETARVSFGKAKFGEMNSELYAAAARTPGPPQVDPYFYYDVTSGNNGFPAGPGFDLVTGLGVSLATDMGNRFFGLVP